MKTNPLLNLAVAALLLTPLRARSEEAKPAAEVKPTTPTSERAAGGRGGQAERLQNLRDKLGLTDEQSAQVKAIFEKHRGEFARLRADQALKPEERRAKMQELRKAEMQEVRGVLTPEQREKMRALRPAGSAAAGRAKAD